MTLLPIDEINQFQSNLSTHYENGLVKSRADEDSIIEELEDLFLLSFARGLESANADLNTAIQASLAEVESTVYANVAGKNWTERVREYFANGGTQADIERIAATESHRITNEAAFDTAMKAGAKTKTWNCSMLPTSREQHIFLDGVTAPMDGYFYTYTGARTLFPGQFGEPENDVNCLCWLTFK